MTYDEHEKLRKMAYDLEAYVNLQDDEYREMCKGLIYLVDYDAFLSKNMQQALMQQVEEALTYHKEHCTIVKRTEKVEQVWYELEWDNI